MMALVFSHGRRFNEGDYIFTTDILINSGAPIDERGGDTDQTALEKLQAMQVAPGTKGHRERGGLIALLQGQYWRAYGNRNPFLHASSPQDHVLLFMTGAANSDDDGSNVVDSMRVRSVPPISRHSVLQALYDHEETFYAFLHILFIVQQDDATSQHHPLRLFHGMQDSILANVAAFAGVCGASLANVSNAATILEELIAAEEQEGMEDSKDEMATKTRWCATKDRFRQKNLWMRQTTMKRRRRMRWPTFLSWTTMMMTFKLETNRQGSRSDHQIDAAGFHVHVSTVTHWIAHLNV
jgi:hypothetical protein